jgi:glutamyl-Q tRNA(Asp) synthetase
LHVGSVVAAVGSFLQARSQKGEWLVRMEDIDPPREVAGAADDILRTLTSLGLHWDGDVVYQSTRASAYEEAIESLRRTGSLYACGCSRREIADSSLPGIEGPVYPGTCRTGLAAGRDARAWRVRTDAAVVEFDDRWQGKFSCDLDREIGDFVVRRADGLVAYQLAVVVDDAAQGITEVVRGADLLFSTPRQLHVQRLLGLPAPRHAHLPVVVNAHGEKLSKQTGAVAVSAQSPLPLLRRVLSFLGQAAPVEIEQGDLGSFWKFAISTWDADRVPRRRAGAFT